MNSEGVVKSKGRSTMSTNKLLQTLSEDPQLEKQIGCMAGILQIFDRHQVLTGRRLYGHKRIAGIQSGQVSPRNQSGESINEDTHQSDTEGRRKPEDTVQKYKQNSSVPSTPTKRNGASSQDQNFHQPQQSRKDVFVIDSMYNHIQSTNNRSSELSKTSYDPSQYPPYPVPPRRLDSSRSLHEPRLMTSNYEGKVNPRRSVDTAERAAAAAARGALKELSRIPDSALLIPDLLDNYDNGPPMAQHPSRQGLINPYKSKPETPPRTSTPPELSESLRLLAKLRGEGPTHTLVNNSFSSHQKSHQHHLSKPLLVDLAKDKEMPTVTKPSYNRNSSERQIPSRLSSYEPSRVSSVDFTLEGGANSREVPRLSLDGRGAGSYRSTQKFHSSKNATVSRSVSCSTSECDTESNNEKRASFSSNVVAKLMGLEEMPCEFTRENSNSKMMMMVTSPKIESSNPSALQTIRSLTSANSSISNMTDPEACSIGQCGKYVSPSFFPSKRREDVNIAMDLEEGEDDYLHFQDSLSQFNPSQSEFDDLGNTFHQTKSHYFTEDCPPYVLSSAAKLCAQIEEMQRKDSWHKSETEEKSTRSMPVLQSAKQDLEALRQLLGSIHLKGHYSGARVEKDKAQSEDSEELSSHGTRRFQNDLSSGQAEWKTKRRLKYDSEAIIHPESKLSYRRTPSEATSPYRSQIRNAEATVASRDCSVVKNSSPEYYRPPRIMREMRCDSAYPSPNSPRKSSSSEGSNGRNGQSSINNRQANRRGVTDEAMNSFNSSSSHQFPQKQVTQLLSSPRTPHYESSPASVLAKEARNSKNYNGKQLTKQLPEKTKKPAAIHKDIKEDQRVPQKLERKYSPSNGVTSSITNPRVVTPRSTRAIQSPETDSKCIRGVQTMSLPRADQKVKRKISFLETELTEESNSDAKANVKGDDHCHVSKDQIMQNKLDSNFNDPTIETKNVVGSLGPSTPFDNITILQAEPARSVANQLPTNVKTKCILRVDSAPCQDAALNLLAKENDDTESQGDKSTGSCEQPSPISVLDSPFYHEEDISSPPDSKEFKLDFKEDMDNDRLTKGIAQVIESTEDIHRVTVKSDQISIVSKEDTDFEYVKQLISRGACARNKDEKEEEGISFKLAPLEPRLFLLLEGERKEKDGDSWRRKLLFDVVNVSLKKEVSIWLCLQEKPWILVNQQKAVNISSKLIGCSSLLDPFIEGINEEDNSVRLSRDGGNLLLREIWEEIGRGKGRLRKQRKPKGGSEEEEEDEMENEDDEEHSESTFRLLEADMKREGRGEWCEQMLAEQKGDIAHDIERLIFKDLIHQILRDLGKPAPPLPPPPPVSASSTSAMSTSSPKAAVSSYSGGGASSYTASACAMAKRKLASSSSCA